MKRARIGTWLAVALCGLLSARTGFAAETPRMDEIDLRAIPLIDALRLIARQARLNLVASSEAAKVPVSLYLRDVPAQAAIEELCKSHNLWFKKDEATGILRIMTTQEFQRDLNSFREEKTEVFTLLYPNPSSIALAIRDLYGDRVQLSLGDEQSTDDARELEERLSRFDTIDQRSQGLGLFQGSGTSTSTGTAGGSGRGSNSFSGSGSNRFSDTGNGVAQRSDARRQVLGPTELRRDSGSEFTNLTPEQAQTVQKALETGRSPDEVNATLQNLRRQQATIFVTINRRNNILAVRTSDPQTMQEIRTLVARLDVPTPLILLEVKVLSIELGDGFRSVFDYQFSDGVNNAGGFSSGSIQPPAADILSGIARRGAPLDIGGTGVNGGDLTFQFVNNNFRARLQMLEDKNRVTAMATPILMTANSEVSRLFIGEERPIIRNISSQTVVNDNTVTSNPNTTVEFRPVGTTLLITPNINSDRTVTLRLLQENSSISPRAATIPVVSGNGSLQEQPVDVVTSRTVSGTVVAKDGLFVAIGGLIEDGARDQRTQVPILGKIPGLGTFFRRQNTGRSRREMIVLVRPHILSTPSEGEALSQRLMNDLSLHPKAVLPDGSMKTYDAREVTQPTPTDSRLKSIPRVHNLKNEGE